MTIELTVKQAVAAKYLGDNETTEVLFGGGAGGAKSFLGCLWLFDRCTRLPGTRWLMGRNKLKDLKATTLQTFFEVGKMLGYSDIYNYNANESTITFTNGSVILLKDLFTYPKDPYFDRLGSLEITGAFIDEANQVSVKAKNVVKSRIRYKLDAFTITGEPTENLKVAEYDEDDMPIKWIDSNGIICGGLIPKALFTCNPAKNWVYTDFYKPDRDNELNSDRKFVQALATDNKYISKHYIENLKRLDKASKQRLLYGNWEYDNDPSKLIEFDAIVDLFSNNGVKGGTKYITADVARLGSDKMVIILWDGLIAEKIITINKSKLDKVAEVINKLKKEHNVRKSHIIADEDGVGGGLIDFTGYKGFVNNSSALKGENYANLKSQCYYKLAELINAGEIWIKDDTYRDQIIEELETVKRYKMDSDGKMRVLIKELVKQLIGRSPDFADALMMRMYYEIKGKSTFSSSGVVSN